MRDFLLPLAFWGLIAYWFFGGFEDTDAKHDAGYGDGYAVGYNTACKIRTTLIEGDWSSEAYSEGYAAGVTDGTVACLADSSQ